MDKSTVIVVGGGIGGLASALALACAGLEVTVIEKESTLGGKIRQIQAGEQAIDSGPTVFTMRWVFDELFRQAGTSLEDEMQISPLAVLARHAWSKDETLDLFADRMQSAEAIAQFSSRAEANRFLDFCSQASQLYQALKKPYMLSGRPSMSSMMASLGTSGSKVLFDIGLFSNLWKTLGRYFHDPRLRQLFGRYATYCGSSPFEAPATLMLIAEVEMQGVWSVAGGMSTLVKTLQRLAEQKGVRFITGHPCTEILLNNRRVCGVRLDNDDVHYAHSIIFNGDARALQVGLLGAGLKNASTIDRQATPSLSALTWSMVAKPQGFPLLRHTVFFNANYQAEFDDIFLRRQLPQQPTVYICAQDQTDVHLDYPHEQGIFCLVNAPAHLSPRPELTTEEIEACESQAFALLKQCGLELNPNFNTVTRTSPHTFSQLFPATGGALYGTASHGWMGVFKRPAAQSTIPGLYLTGGSVHPGAGVPMAALSGRMAAATLMGHLGLIKPSGKELISGGTSMP